jgi:hypothetical protein
VIGRQEYLQVADQVAEHEAHEHKARDGHYKFSPNGRREEITDEAHRK